MSSWPALQRHAARLRPGYAAEAALQAAADDFSGAPLPISAELGTLPSILVLPGELHLAADAAEAAIMASKLAIFQRGGMPVRPIKQTVEASQGRETLTAALAELKVTHLDSLQRCKT